MTSSFFTSDLHLISVGSCFFWRDIHLPKTSHKVDSCVGTDVFYFTDSRTSLYVRRNKLFSLIPQVLTFLKTPHSTHPYGFSSYSSSPLGGLDTRLKRGQGPTDVCVFDAYVHLLQFPGSSSVVYLLSPLTLLYSWRQGVSVRRLKWWEIPSWVVRLVQRFCFVNVSGIILFYNHLYTSLSFYPEFFSFRQ